MTIPFTDIFKNMKARLFPATAQTKPSAAPVVRVEKSLSDRLSKTVLPTRARERMPVSIEAALTAGPTPAPMPPRTISLDPARKQGSSFIKMSPAPADLPAERTISLQISDILDQLPPAAIKPRDSFSPDRVIVLKATEVEKGMASGKPTVSLASLYQQAPEIFLNSISPDDATPVSLPFDKVLDQFANLRVRPDQVSEQEVPQLETPFLAVTLEDTQRFGTTMKPLEASSNPPVKVQPATAENISAAEPEPAVREVKRSANPPSPRPVISLRDLDALEATPVTAGKAPAQSETKQQDLPKISPHKIPFHLPPNGTGEPASERVPASSGPPVPIVPVDRKATEEKSAGPVSVEKSAEPLAGKIAEDMTAPPVSVPKTEELPAAKGAEPPAIEPKVTPPAKVPFKFKSPSDDIRPKFTLVPGTEPKKAAPTIKLSSKGEDARIRLPLQPLLQEVPAFQLHGSPMSVGEDVLIELPLSLIEPQLASGRVMIGAKVFQRAIPEAHRGLLIVDQNETPITLPLQVILKHLPSDSLRARPDQEAAVKLKHEITTPFSIQAEQDAKRFGAMAAAAPAIAGGTPTKAENSEAVRPGTATEAIEIKKTAEEADPKLALAQASALPGVGACAISFADGLNLAGNIPSELGADGICAMTPSLWQRIGTHMQDTKLGSFKSMTLHCVDSSLTFFMEGGLCLTAVHAGGTDLSGKTQTELEAIVQKLSKTYAQPESTHTGQQGKD